MANKSYRWAFDCGKWNPSKHEWIFASSLIHEQEKERIGKFVFKRDAKNAIAGRLLIRKFLTHTLNLKWNEIQIKRTENGKPYVENSSNVNFNVSHHENFVVLAGEIKTNAVGIDVMKVDYRKVNKFEDFLRLMRKQLSPEELKTINSLNTKEEMCRLFYRMWTLKESYVKAIGTGITTVPLSEVSFHIKTIELRNNFTDDTELFVKGKHMSDWTFHEHLIDTDTYVSVALSPKISHNSEKFMFIPFEDLIKGAQELTPPDEEYGENFIRKLPHP